MGRLRVAVVTAFVEEDWHSQQLLAALGGLCEADVVDPSVFSAQLRHGALQVKVGTEDAARWDAFVLARGMSPRGDPDVQFAIYRALEESGVVVANRIGPLLDAQDKFRTSFLLRRAGVPTPRAAVVQTGDDAARVVELFGDAVLKPMAGSLGEGVERASGPNGQRRARQRVEEEGALYLQQYVPNDGRDVRVFVVGGVAVTAVERIAARGEWRTNVARGALARAVTPSRAAVDAAERAARVLGLDYTGVDLIETERGPQIIEVNGNPSWDFILRATGEDMAEHIARYVVGRALARRARRRPGAGT
ncbi:MAG: RimK family alpha-L-glutamate ligase, partial [Myxococcales bacterium]